MDANRFDTLARNVGTPTSRRAALGASLAGGVLGALGLGRAAPVVQAAQGQTCVLGFTANVRTGPSASRPFTQGAQPGQLQAQVSFTLSESGNIEHGELRLPNNTSVPLVGQATGHSLQLRATLGPDLTLVAVGVGEQEIAACQGAIDGLLTGPGLGDLGDWHAVALQQGQSGASNNATADQGDKNGKRDKSDKGGKNDRQNQGAAPATATATAVSQGRGNQGSNTSGSGTTSQTCPRGQTFCNREEGYCADLMVDPLNCGTCGNQCAVNNCTGGVCSEATASTQNGCQPPRAICNGQCVDISRDVFNCGACSTVCAIDEVCTSGKCVAQSSTTQPQGACAAGQTVCGADCVDLTKDVFNCGACGNVCALDEDCRDSKCAPIDSGETCPAGQTRCGDVCTDLQTDAANCNACGTACAADETCAGGACTASTTPTLCPAGQVRCDGVCKEALPNFGSQGISCPGGGSAPTECPSGQVICNGACFPEGACQPADCAPGWGYCYGVCRDFQNDPGYCGGCNLPCTGNNYCSGGRCFGCSSNLTACGQECVDTKTDLNNCGGCGNLCGTQCINGECTGVGPTPGCAPGTTRCGNACVDLSRDSANCGACGKVCDPADSTCYPPGECGFSQAYCETLGKQACGLGCVPRSDPFNCGGCGKVCPGGYACDPDLEICYIIGGSKRDGVKPTQQQTLAPTDQQTLAPTDEVTCTTGLDNCSGVCTDLTSDPFNCGACGTICDAGDTCQQGQCTPPSPAADSQTQAPATSSCPAGQTDCGGVCTDLTSDSLNCGSCGIACGPDSSCVSGVCSEPPAPVAPDNGTDTAPEEDTTTETEPATETTTCVDAGGACDTGSPDTCCSGVCNDDGTCA